MTQFTEHERELQLTFDFGLGKPIVAAFDGGKVSSDAGLVLVRSADDSLRLSEQIAFCVRESRQLGKIRHSLVSQIRQRLLMICAGYEDLNDADQTASDAMHKLASGLNPDSDRDLASDSTLQRFESGRSEEELNFLEELFVHVFIQKQKRCPNKITLDMDTHCDEVHGYQQLSFYNGFYKTYCYTPLFIFAGTFPLAAMLRPGNAAPAEGAVRALRTVVEALRKAWPNVVIELRADAGFSTPELYSYCENAGIFYYIGFKPNSHVHLKARPLIARAKADFVKVYGQPAELTSKEAKKARKARWRKNEERIRFSSKAEGRMQEHFEDPNEYRIRIVGDVSYQADNWQVKRRMIARIDYTPEGPEIRYIVTNYFGGRPKWIYEDKYCKRGQCENYIKEMKSMHSDRLSCQEYSSNRFRLLMHAFAYVLLNEIRERLPKRLITISLQTVRLRLIKIGVVVYEQARRVRLRLASRSPSQFLFEQVASNF